MLARYAHSTVATTAFTDWPMIVTAGSSAAAPPDPRSPSAAEARKATAATSHSAAPTNAPGRQSRQQWRVFGLKR